mgnify:FL=1
MEHDDCTALVTLTRADIIESIHYGAFTLVDRQGNLVASQGNPETLTYPRSSMKPLQVIPFIENKGHKKFKLTLEETAIMCASHHGTDAHVAVLKSMHQKIGIDLSHLKCGVHWPTDKATADAMRTRAEEPNSYRHNCSGKHTGMLAFAKMQQLSLDDYLENGHPIQKEIYRAVGEMCDMATDTMPIGVDGCSAPVFGIPLRNFALGIARLCQPQDLAPSRARACKHIAKAMYSFPIMVAGPNAFDTVLMQTMQGKLICKGGAEGYQAVGILPGAFGKGSPALGLAIKISDGDLTRRAVTCVAIEILNALGLFSTDQYQALRQFGRKPLQNWRGIEIGEMNVTFELPKFSW